MTPTEGYLIALGVVVAYFVVLYILYRQHRIGPDRPLSFFGPALMLKTKRGLGFLERAGRFRRTWSILGDIGLVLAGIAMVGIVALLVLDAIVALRVPASQAPQVSEALGIPGLNPIIPLGYGIVALVVGIVLHELMHGVMARSQNIGVKSVGILWFVVPVGAFVEQDDAQMQAAPRRPRGRVAAAGILANFALAVAFLLLLSITVSTSLAPNADGVGVSYVVPGFPAANASLAPGDILTEVNGTPVTTSLQLYEALNRTTGNERIDIAFYSSSTGGIVTRSVTLAPASAYYANPPDPQKGFLGVAPSFLTPGELKGELTNPFASPYGPVLGATYWIVLPLAGLEPIQGSSAAFFHVTGPLAGLGSGGFWILANLLFWLSWMNLLLGLSNALPLVPLDGGLLFRDFAAAIVRRFRRSWDEARLDRFAGRAVAASSVLVLFLLVWQFIAPRL